MQNRIKNILPDGSFIEFSYDPINLKKIIKKNKYENILYTHEFLKYDLSGKLLREKLITEAGIIDYKLDKKGRITLIKSQYHSQGITYDEIGRISKISNTGFFNDETEYAYDDLNQIISETNLFPNSYEYDSHFNRIKKNDFDYEINNLNELKAISSDQNVTILPQNPPCHCTFEYDKNGNPVSKKTLAEETKYKYDSLDRLIRVENPNYILDFTYDPFNRRLSKKTHKLIQGYMSSYWEDNFEYFLYDNQNEIGSFDENFNQKELRILSDTKTAEIASAIAFEIDGYFYAPIYDVSGNVVSLIYNGGLYEQYKYSAFGERKIYSCLQYEKEKSQINNPWQFCSKRIDEETGLIFFGRRYYDPILGRWLTPDPKGFKDGLNLYAFVLNDPLIKMDLYGLEVYYPPLVTATWSLAATQPHIWQFTPSQRLVVGSNERPGIGIGYINGINTTLNEARRDGERISSMIGNSKVNVTYNRTLGRREIDFVRCCFELGNRNYITKAGRELMKEWFDFFSKEKQNCYLQVCFSEGALITRNALSQMPEYLRKKIIVLAIAPGAYIDKELCRSIHHYVSKKDHIPDLDYFGKRENSHSTTILEPHHSVMDSDHHFDSPTYEKKIEEHLNFYLKHPEG
ncbi:MAG: RHS repeat-associated core domain-containing protein [Parachlamydiales bacterium]